MTRLEELLSNGTLHTVAARSETLEQFCASLGMQRKAYESAVRRLRLAGRAIPSFSELQRQYDNTQSGAEKARAAEFAHTQIGAADTQTGEFDEEEATQPGVPPTGRVQPADEPRTIEHDIADRKRRAELVSLKARLASALEQLEQARYEMSVAFDVPNAMPHVDPIRPREHTSGLREATAVACASDWHIEETVDLGQVNGVNEYNLDIARRRAERYFSGLSYLIRYHQDHFAIRDLILWLGGDLITGYLREEDIENNGATPTQAIAILQSWIADGIRSVLQSTDIELMTVVCNSGNHGRLTKKVQARNREGNSIEWLLYRWLAKEFANEPRVKFVLPLGAQTYVEVYEWVIRFTHGDDTNYGGGIGGIMIPIRKAIAKWQTVRHADLTVLGHYHQEHFLRDLVVNGSLVGYNEYALKIAAPFEDPRQAFFLMDKLRGITFPSTIWVADRDGAKGRAA